MGIQRAEIGIYTEMPIEEYIERGPRTYSHPSFNIHDHEIPCYWNLYPKNKFLPILIDRSHLAYLVGEEGPVHITPTVLHHGAIFVPHVDGEHKRSIEPGLQSVVVARVNLLTPQNCTHDMFYRLRQKQEYLLRRNLPVSTYMSDLLKKAKRA